MILVTLAAGFLLVGQVPHRSASEKAIEARRRVELARAREMVAEARENLRRFEKEKASLAQRFSEHGLLRNVEHDFSTDGTYVSHEHKHEEREDPHWVRAQQRRLESNERARRELTADFQRGIDRRTERRRQLAREEARSQYRREEAAREARREEQRRDERRQEERRNEERRRNR